jgi:hypothetical protein
MQKDVLIRYINDLNAREFLLISQIVKNFGKSSVTGMVHRSAYLCRNVHRYGGACIRPAAPTRFGLTPHLPLAKTSADP